MKQSSLVICSLLFSFFFFFGCDKKAEIKETIATAEKTSFNMYEMSEMSALMEQMYVDNMRIKNGLIEGDTVFGNFPELHKNIFTAKLTDETDRDLFFANSAQQFITIEKQFYQSEKEDQKANFNNIVSSCIACHEKKCGGPIVRIKKLYIP